MPLEHPFFKGGPSSAFHQVDFRRGPYYTPSDRASLIDPLTTVYEPLMHYFDITLAQWGNLLLVHFRAQNARISDIEARLGNIKAILRYLEVVISERNTIVLICI